jgi:hypothetical protein
MRPHDSRVTATADRMTSMRDGAFIDDETRLSDGPRRGHVRDVKWQVKRP